VRKSSRDSLKIKGKKVEQDEEGEFEVCVQQMSYHAFDNDLKAHFEQCGEVLSSRVLTKPDGKSKGTGFVKFGSKSAYTKALELDGSDLCGRPIKVSEAQNRTDNARTNGGGFGARQDNGRQNSRPQQSFESNANIESNTLFIGGLSYGSTVESMKQHFGSCGEVLSARIVTDRETGKVLFHLMSRIKVSGILNLPMSRVPRMPTRI
jgi:nucleolin